jgi:hypothetical protein
MKSSAYLLLVLWLGVIAGFFSDAAQAQSCEETAKQKNVACSRTASEGSQTCVATAKRELTACDRTQNQAVDTCRQASTTEYAQCDANDRAPLVSRHRNSGT